MAPGWQAAVLLPLLRRRLLPRRCSAGRRRGWSTSRAQGWSHRVRRRRGEARTTPVPVSCSAPASRGVEGLCAAGLG